MTPSAKGAGSAGAPKRRRRSNNSSDVDDTYSYGGGDGSGDLHYALLCRRNNTRSLHSAVRLIRVQLLKMCPKEAEAYLKQSGCDITPVLT